MGEHGAHPAGGVGLFPGGLEQERRFFVLRAGDVQGKGLLDGFMRREWEPEELIAS